MDEGGRPVRPLEEMSAKKEAVKGIGIVVGDVRNDLISDLLKLEPLILLTFK